MNDLLGDTNVQAIAAIESRMRPLPPPETDIVLLAEDRLGAPVLERMGVPSHRVGEILAGLNGALAGIVKHRWVRAGQPHVSRYCARCMQDLCICPRGRDVNRDDHTDR